MPIRFSVSHWCLGLEPPANAAAFARLADESGRSITAIEMPPMNAIAAAREAGLDVLNLPAAGMQGIALNKPGDHAELLPRIEDTIARASEHGVGQVIVFSGNRDGQSDEAGAEATVAALGHLAPVAEKAGVTLTLELLNAFDHPGYMADHTAWAVAVIDAVGSASIKLLYDVYHMHRMGEPLLDDLRRHADRIAHVHIAGSPKRDFPGEGQAIDYSELLPALLETGYAGPIGLEFLPDPNADPVSAMVEAARVLSASVSDAV